MRPMDELSAWAWSPSDEVWDCRHLYPTREDALKAGADALKVGHVYTGCARQMTPEMVAREIVRVLDWEYVDEGLAEETGIDDTWVPDGVTPYWVDDVMLRHITAAVREIGMRPWHTISKVQEHAIGKSDG